MRDLREKIEGEINTNRSQNDRATPDYILADYLLDCLKAFDKAVNARDDSQSSKELDENYPHYPNID